jgi:hypothetical protein
MTVMRRTLALALLLVLTFGVAGCVHLTVVPSEQGPPATTAPQASDTTIPVSSPPTPTPAAASSLTPAAPQTQPAAPVAPSAALHTPKTGSAERKAILDTLRPAVQAMLHQPVAFKCDVFEVESGWAFVRGTPVRPDGGKIDYNKTKYKAALADGFFDNNFAALLHFKGGAWHVATWEVGATDVAWEPWAHDYEAPRAIFH